MAKESPGILADCMDALVPAILEEQEIVRRVESLFALAAQIEARLSAAQRQMDAIMPTLLAKAFRGELVPQDPADESATALLERVRQRTTNKPSTENDYAQEETTRSRASRNWKPQHR